MSELKTNKISPAVGTGVVLGDSGDTITIPNGVTFANNGTATGFSTGTVKYIGTSSLAADINALGADVTFADGEATITVPAADVVGLSSIILVFIGSIRIDIGSSHTYANFRIQRTAPSAVNYQSSEIGNTSGTASAWYGVSRLMQTDSSLGSGDHTYKMYFRKANGNTFSSGNIFYKYAGWQILAFGI
jgi:hypothetical protein|tara:strand:- start:1524 stop:2090 length:567 start_codon:yes stop_codon:yes gene_type:complete